MVASKMPDKVLPPPATETSVDRRFEAVSPAVLEKLLIASRTADKKFLKTGSLTLGTLGT